MKYRHRVNKNTFMMNDKKADYSNENMEWYWKLNVFGIKLQKKKRKYKKGLSYFRIKYIRINAKLYTCYPASEDNLFIMKKL